MRKIISLVLCCIMLITSFTAIYAEEEAQNYNYDKIVAVFQNAGVIDSGEMNDADFASVLTRAEFADYVAKLMNVHASANDIMYVDVPTDNLYAGSINYLAQSGILSVPADMRFYPDAAVTYDEALAMILRAAGYEIVAQVNGGYPAGYRSVASTLKIKTLAKNANSLTMGEGLRLLLEGATAGMYASGESGAKGYQFKTKDDTLLSSYHNIYLQEGKMYSANGASISKSYSADENKANIDGLLYACRQDLNAENFLGNNIEFFYKLDDSDDNAELIYLEKKSSDSEIEILSENIVSFDPASFTVKYFKTSDSAKTTTATIMRSAGIVYNGRPDDGSVSALINSLKDDNCHGTICLKDTDSQSGYDLIIIKRYKTAAVTGYSDDTIYNALDTAHNICTNDYGNMTVKTPDGLETKIHKSFPYVADIAESKDKEKLEIIICSESVSGVLNEVNGTNSMVKLDDEYYKVDESYLNQVQAKLTIGVAYTMYMNSEGKITYYVASVNDEYRVGYLLRATAYEEDEYRIKMRIFDHDTSAFDSYILADKVKIDEVQYDNEPLKALSAMPGVTGIVSVNTDDRANSPNVKPQLIRYKSDENKNITAIDTTTLTDEEDEDNTLQSIRTASGKKVNYNGGLKRMDLTIIYNSTNTKVIVVPELDDEGKMEVGGEKTSDVESYFSTMKTDILADKDKEMYAYNYNGSTPYADAVVYVGSAKTTNYNAMMFIEFIKALDKDGEAADAMRVNEAGAEKTYIIDKHTEIPDGITQGDIIGIGQAADGSITQIDFMYDRETDKYCGDRLYNDKYDYHTGAWWDDYIYNLPGYEGSYAYRDVGRQMSKGYVYKRLGTFVQFSYIPGTLEDIEHVDKDGKITKHLSYECVDLNGRPIVVYDSNARGNNHVSNGTIDDILDYKTAGYSCTKMILYSYGTKDCASVFIYK
ncbi:MAG: S-layer homology domain-containing protein [Clostridiales bacterium]|nr:S-layer homology domain-containing protein [Clostridiales bacterium]